MEIGFKLSFYFKNMKWKGFDLDIIMHGMSICNKFDGMMMVEFNMIGLHKRIVHERRAVLIFTEGQEVKEIRISDFMKLHFDNGIHGSFCDVVRAMYKIELDEIDRMVSKYLLEMMFEHIDPASLIAEFIDNKN